MRGWLLFSAVLVCGGCDEPVRGDIRRTGREGGGTEVAPASGDDAGTVRAYIAPASGSTTQGRARLSKAAEGVWLEVELDSAPPGRHGVHVHEHGDCGGERAKNAGAHFSPDPAAAHGLPTDGEHHLGDLGNVDIDAHGHGSLAVLVRSATLERNDPRSLRDRAIVLSATEDRGAGTPSRDDERRIGCGVIPK